MTESQRFREKIRATLMSSRCQKIVLAFGAHRITGLDYSYVALAVLQRVDAVVGLDVRNDYQGKGSGGFESRDPGHGAAILEPPHPLFANTIHEEMLIVHDSTHAVFAAWKGTTVRRLTNEAVAYIADSIYNRNGASGDPTFDPAVDNRPPPAKPFTPADRRVMIAES